MTRRRWIADSWTENTALLVGDQALHLARVLRAEPGMESDVIAGGRVWHAAIASVAEDEVRFDLLTELDSEPALPVTLLLSVFKFDRMEWAIEKVTELGVAQILPVLARRTEKHLAQAAPKRVERWRRVVREAAQQCRRSDTPLVGEAVAIKLVVQQSGTRDQTERDGIDHEKSGSTAAALKVVLSEQEQSVTLRRALGGAITSGAAVPRIEIAIGPEGGWAPEEIALFQAEGWIAVTLGARILRAETAAITALAVIAAFLP
ncbi:MAG TPA: RsmE family RNA methyltransferase [Acidisarcina sp.]